MRARLHKYLAARSRARAVGNERGAALLTVLVALMIISIMLFEFQYTAMVERKLAYNDLNQLQAYYLAKSGARIGLLRVALYAKAKGSNLQNLVPPGMDIKPYFEMIWKLPLPAFPPEKEKIGKLDKADKDAAEKVLQQTRVVDGSSTHVITSEGSKINLNYLQIPAALANERLNLSAPPQNLFQYVASMLVTLLDNFLKDSENPNEEYNNMRPEEVVMDLMDWVNPGPNRLGGGNKDAYYEGLRPPYKAKRGRFFSLDEVKLVKGIDDHLFTKLKPYITVYSYDGKINLNTAGANIYRALYKDFTEDDIKRIMDERSRLGTWSNEKQFVDFVTQTLSRSGFKTLYSNEKEYPFTVDNQSFLIESMGRINKSKSSVQRVIRVAVALAGAKGGQDAPEFGTFELCTAAPGKFWDQRTQKCKTKPTNQNDCVNVLAGTWGPIDGQNCCKINNQPPLCLSASDTSAKGGTANQLKILYWSES